MNRLFSTNRTVLGAALLFLGLFQVHAEPAKPSPSPSPVASSVPTLRMNYDSFRLIHTRNVFDPDRRPVRPVNNAPAFSTTRADYAALTGTLLTADKSYAFFSGSRLEFNKVLALRDKFANATITGITGANIEIERDGKRTTIAVGQTVPFDNQTAPGTPPVEAPPATVSSTDSAAPGVPAATGTTGAAPGAFRPAATGTAPAGATGPKGPPGNLDEIRRRMMEKRQQELK